MSKQPSASSPYFLRTLEALSLVAPFCIASRYEDGFKHCVEASVSGAAALRKRNIKARPIPCAVFARAASEDGETALSIGFSPKQLYDRMDRSAGPPPPYEEWKATVARGVPDEDHPIHEVIEARFGKERALVDLTIGQLRQTGAPATIAIPMTVVATGKGEGWPELSVGPWTIMYMESPHDPQTLATSNAKVNQYANPGFVADLHDMIDLALQLGLDRDRLHAEIRRQQPDVFDACVARIGSLGSIS